MRAISDIEDKIVTWLETGMPGWLVVVVTLLLYPGFALGLPLTLHWSTTGLIEANVMGVALAAVMSLGWLTAQVEAARRRHLVEWSTDLRLLTAEEFEWLAGETFRREGWSVEETGRQEGADGNVDLRLSRGSQRVLVQCKRWDSRLVGVDEIRELAGTLLREGLKGSEGVFVTLSDYSKAAEAEANEIGIETINGRELFARMERVRKPRACPMCRQAMLLDRSSHGWWFRCTAPGCGGKEDLGAEPGRAVELLIQPQLPLRSR